MYSISSRGSYGLHHRSTRLSISLLLVSKRVLRSMSRNSCLLFRQLAQSSCSSSSRCFPSAASASALLLHALTTPYFQRKDESTLLPFTRRSSPMLFPKIFGKVQEAHISGPWASLTSGALNSLLVTEKTRSQRASWVKANPMTFPSVIAKMGFLELMMAKLRSESTSAVTLAICSLVPREVRAGLPKFMRSLPEEKLPPAPEMMINLTASFWLAKWMRLVRVQYMSEVKALYRLGLLKVMQNRLPLRSERMLVWASGMLQYMSCSWSLIGRYAVIQDIIT